MLAPTVAAVFRQWSTACTTRLGSRVSANHMSLRPLAASAAARFSSGTTQQPEIILERLTSSGDAGIAVLTLSRPAAKNALGRRMMDEFRAALADVSRDTQVRVLILRSAVEKVFCAGADLKERATMSPSEAEAFVDGLRSSFQALADLPPPTIACIEGAALGGGLEMALACDFRVVGRGAILGLPETGLAIIPGAGGTQRLPRLVGQERAKELIFTAARLPADKAAQYGLVTRLVDPGAAFEASLAFARQITPQGPVAVRMAKRAIQAGAALPLSPQALAAEKEAYSGVLPTKDRLEGLAAFRDKRAPVYRGE